jgi:hypothetical protein
MHMYIHMNMCVYVYILLSLSLTHTHSTAQEAKKYFSNLDDHHVHFSYDGEQDDDCIDLAFRYVSNPTTYIHTHTYIYGIYIYMYIYINYSKKRADARKEWIAGFTPGTYLDQVRTCVCVCVCVCSA